MNISLVDFWLARLAINNYRLLRALGDFETRIFRRKLLGVTIDRPIFICGLARSGSTMLLELMARHRGVVTHRYRDFPLVTIPIWWNRFLDLTARKVSPQTRAHGDLIQITPQSPEGMEEILWERHSAATRGEREPIEDPEFQRFYGEHVRKLLWLRGGQRYVSKNNYHVGRINSLAKVLPDAQFVIPVRHPLTHVESLVRQHSLFCEFARSDSRVPNMLSAAGHYEFGPQRSARGIDIQAKMVIERHWSEGNEFGGYARLWAEVYGHVLQLLKQPGIATRIHVVQYEQFCAHPQASWQQLAANLELSDTDINCDHIAPPTVSRLSAEQNTAIWTAAGAVAEEFGFE